LAEKPFFNIKDDVPLKVKNSVLYASSEYIPTAKVCIRIVIRIILKDLNPSSEVMNPDQDPTLTPS
jgi:hypothetical protein